LGEESGDSSPLDCKDDKSLSTLWLENTIKWTGVGSLQRKLAGLRCEYPRSRTNKNQSFPSPVEMALGKQVQRAVADFYAMIHLIKTETLGLTNRFQESSWQMHSFSPPKKRHLKYSHSHRWSQGGIGGNLN